MNTWPYSLLCLRLNSPQKLLTDGVGRYCPDQMFETLPGNLNMQL